MSFPIAHWPDAHFPNAHWPHEAVVVRQGGGGGPKKKFKSWDQRQRERLEQLRKDAEQRDKADAERRAHKNKSRYGDMPKPLEAVLAMAPTYEPLNPEEVAAYTRSLTIPNDDEEAMALILALL